MERGCASTASRIDEPDVAELAPLKGRYADSYSKTPARCSHRSAAGARTRQHARRRRKHRDRRGGAARVPRPRVSRLSEPQRAEFLHHSMMFFTRGPRLDKKAVTITRFQPRSEYDGGQRELEAHLRLTRFDPDKDQVRRRRATRSPAARVEGPRRAELHQGRDRPTLSHAVVPHGGVRELRMNVNGEPKLTVRRRSRIRRHRRSRAARNSRSSAIS